jgi:hypothetical protein
VVKGIGTAEISCHSNANDSIYFIQKNETQSGEILRPMLFPQEDGKGLVCMDGR